MDHLPRRNGSLPAHPIAKSCEQRAYGSFHGCEMRSSVLSLKSAGRQTESTPGYRRMLWWQTGRGLNPRLPSERIWREFLLAYRT